MSLAKRNDMVEALPADGTDQPLRICVLPEQLRCDGAVADTHDLRSPTHGMTIGGIAVSNQVTRHVIPREGCSNLSGDPLRCRMASNPNRFNPPPVVAQDHQSVQEPKVDGWTIRKPIAAIPAGLWRKVLRVWCDGRPPFTIYLATMVSPTSMPSLSSSLPINPKKGQ